MQKYCLSLVIVLLVFGCRSAPDQRESTAQDSSETVDKDQHADEVEQTLSARSEARAAASALAENTIWPKNGGFTLRLATDDDNHVGYALSQLGDWNGGRARDMTAGVDELAHLDRDGFAYIIYVSSDAPSFAQRFETNAPVADLRDLPRGYGGSVLLPATDPEKLAEELETYCESKSRCRGRFHTRTGGQMVRADVAWVDGSDTFPPEHFGSSDAPFAEDTPATIAFRDADEPISAYARLDDTGQLAALHFVAEASAGLTSDSKRNKRVWGRYVMTNEIHRSIWHARRARGDEIREVHDATLLMGPTASGSWSADIVATQTEVGAAITDLDPGAVELSQVSLESPDLTFEWRGDLQQIAFSDQTILDGQADHFGELAPTDLERLSSLWKWLPAASYPTRFAQSWLLGRTGEKRHSTGVDWRDLRPALSMASAVRGSTDFEGFELQTFAITAAFDTVRSRDDLLETARSWGAYHEREVIAEATDGDDGRFIAHVATKNAEDAFGDPTYVDQGLFEVDLEAIYKRSRPKNMLDMATDYFLRDKFGRSAIRTRRSDNALVVSLRPALAADGTRVFRGLPESDAAPIAVEVSSCLAEARVLSNRKPREFSRQRTHIERPSNGKGRLTRRPPSPSPRPSARTAETT